jgi:hypothetical protein
MESLVTSGRIVDIILAIILIEYLALCLYLGRSAPWLALAGYLASGAFLLLALRVALTDGSWVWIAAFLAGAGVVHAIDLRSRLMIVIRSN